VGAGLDERFYDFNRGLVDAVKGFLDVFLAGRDVPRFYVLETLARVPYFAYVSVLHLRETFGQRDDDHVARIRVHFAEADNELHHLLMMEALGGNASVVDRCLAQTLAVGYFGYCCALYATNRRLAYHLSELIEAHAYETYDDYLRREGPALKARAPPPVIRDYYQSVDGAPPKTLYDAFVRVRDDEQSHWASLAGLVQFDALGGGSVATPPCAADDEACLAAPDECLVPAVSR
jgi:ubiquinol oxidase